ncbi:MAG: rod shape-determining protein [Myxococcota bacterium]
MSGAAADLGVDLGTANTRIVARSRGIVLDVPTVVATAPRPKGREVVAIGDEAKKMIGRTPEGTKVVRPVRGGLVADFEATEQLLRAMLKQVGGSGLRKPRLLVCVPSGTTEAERRAVQECARAAGAGQVLLVPAPIAAAVGADLPVSEPVGSMIVDVGGGRTHVAVLSLGGMVVRRSLQVAGDDLDEAVSAWLRNTHNLQVGERTAETLKVHVGSLTPKLHPELRMRIRGRDLPSGRPRELEVTAEDVAAAVAGPIGQIRQVVLEALRETPPELAADIVDRGVLLCGGTSYLRGLDVLLREDTGLPVLQAEAAAQCVARGAERLLDDAEFLERVAAIET